MKLKIIIICILFCCKSACFSQQANNWYFGQNARITFNTTPPTALLLSQLSTSEGCSSISDNNGNTLFYTNGVTVWTRLNVPMANGTGLMGGLSSTTSSFIVQKPGSPNIYYIFTCDEDENNYLNGYRYSEVDMTLNGGLGAVTSNKNILLYAPCTEKIAATSHANGSDVWVITKENNTHNYRTFKVTCNGVETTPVISTLDTLDGRILGNKTGYLKASHDGKILVNARNNEGAFDVMKFDNATGVISNRMKIKNTPLAINCYGVEFSPNSKLLYINGAYLYQYKIDIYDSATINDSRYKVDTQFFSKPALQLGPDGKIYNAKDTTLNVVSNPNLYGAACNYIYQAVSLLGRHSYYGLSNFFSRYLSNSYLNFSYNFQSDCRTVNFTASSTIPGPVTYTWNFGDATTATGQTVSHLFPTTPNTFTVTVTINNASVCGSSSSYSQVITFNRNAPTSVFGFTTTCNNLNVAFHDSSTVGAGGTITNHFWDFGDGATSTQTNPSHTYLAYGDYTVQLITVSNDACQTKDTTTRLVRIAAKPVAGFSFTSGCYTSPVQLTTNCSIVNGNIVAWHWDFGDGNTSNLQFPATHLYASPGTYTIKLVCTSNLNCVSDTFRLPVTVGAIPTVGFSLPTVCLLDASATFGNNSSTTDGSTLSYLWNFADPNASAGNPNTSTQTSPTHIYSQAANYAVTLTVNSPLGCSATLNQNFTVNGAVPTAGFRLLNQTQICSNTDVSIKDSSYVNFGNISKVEIQWGDGNTTIDTSPGQAPNGEIYTHRYANFSNPPSQPFTIRMLSYSGIICVDDHQQIITVYASPEIRFDPIPEVCKESAPVIISQATEIWGLSGTGTYSGTGITNGSTGSFNPAIADTGIHQVTYTFISTAGCRADSIQVIRVNPTPKASFSFVHGCLPNATIAFTGNGNLPGGANSSLQYNWNFGDPLATTGNPNTSTLNSPAHTYQSLASYPVQLEVVSPKGCRHDTTINLLPDVAIFPQPIADFIIDSTKKICAGSPVYFINQSNSGGQPVSQYNWNFGDAGTASAQSPNHVYTSQNTYDVTLWIQNTKGCRSVIDTQTIIVHSTPVADFRYDSACFGKPVQFTDRSTNQLGTISIWDWDLGNGSTSPNQHPTATYNEYRNFTATLKAATANGCISTPVSKTFTIRRVNVLAGNDTSIARNQPLQLLASGANSYVWSPAFGLNNPNIKNPIAILNNGTLQSYYLEGRTTEGCLGHDTIKITIFEKAGFYIPSAFSPNNDGLNEYLQPICIGIKQFGYFKVFDRWGKLVFSSKSQFAKWDGRFIGQAAPAGSYVWVAEAVSFEGKLMQKKGVVVLIR